MIGTIALGPPRAFHTDTAPVEHLVEEAFGPGSGFGQTLEELFHNAEKPLYRYLLALVRDDNLALDCVQDAFLRAHQSIRAGRPVNRQWLFKVARNRAVDEIRRRSRIRTDEEALERLGASDKTDQSLVVRQALGRLDPLDAQVLILFAVEGYRTDEIGERLGVSGAAVRQRLYRARERFRKVYEEAA